MSQIRRRIQADLAREARPHAMRAQETPHEGTGTAFPLGAGHMHDVEAVDIVVLRGPSIRSVSFHLFSYPGVKLLPYAPIDAAIPASRSDSGVPSEKHLGSGGHHEAKPASKWMPSSAETAAASIRGV